MRAHWFQHVPFEGLGIIESWLDDAGCEKTSTTFFEGGHLPDLDAIDFLIIMGGPMSVNDEDIFPWLRAEKQFVHDAVVSGKPVLGICLGAQLIASAMGAAVYPHHEKEIGWFPVNAIPSADASVFRFPTTATVFHWHGETFDLPHKAVPLAKSEACQNQAFQIGQSVIGLQFHLETTPASARAIVDHCQNELSSSKFVMDATSILAATDKNCTTANQLMGDVLAYLTRITL